VEQTLSSPPGRGTVRAMIRLRILLFAVAGCVCALAADATAGGTNVPPPSKVYIIGNGSPDFLGFTNVYLTRRNESSVALESHLGADHDDEGDILYFQWFDDGTVASNLPRFTNDYSQGLQTLRVIVSDGAEMLDLQVPLEVISPLDATRRLRADLELAGVRENIDRLRPLLRLAEKALDHRHWSIGKRRLERFQNRASKVIDTDGESGAALVERWNVAASHIIQSIRRIRKGDATPSGVFPGPV
jgi:hypothetical protein